MASTYTLQFLVQLLRTVLITLETQLLSIARPSTQISEQLQQCFPQMTCNTCDHYCGSVLRGLTALMC